jgi:hypothetical protein
VRSDYSAQTRLHCATGSQLEPQRGAFFAALSAKVCDGSTDTMEHLCVGVELEETKNVFSSAATRSTVLIMGHTS